MHPLRKQRLILVVFIVVFSSLAAALIGFALRDNINFFYPPSKISEAPMGALIRAGGCVIPGSVERSQTDLKVSFSITDGIAALRIVYNGILPDLFKEGEAAIAIGKMTQGTLQATQVLAKHDESYTPPEVAEAMAKASTEKGAQYQCQNMGLNANKIRTNT